jgi:2-polyprenyl-3-methyl-5-hydroxy-6-metoxy-1,4-benzoquinol methylase
VTAIDLGRGLSPGTLRSANSEVFVPMSNTAKPADEYDVVMCYRYFLHREPENRSVIEAHLNSNPTIWQLIERFSQSSEYETMEIDAGCLGIWRRQDARDVRIDASKTAKAEILNHIQKIWSLYGIEDPFYSVITDPTYRGPNITSALTEKFYQSGSDGVANLRLACQRNRIDVDSRWHILDLGCGVGRIGEHFCRSFEYYYGVDISEGHLARAKSRFEEQNITNSRLFLLNQALESDIRFDVFYSMIVLQHNPPPIIYHLLDMFLPKLKSNGLAFFQVPCHLYGYEFDTDDYLAGRGKHDGMEMHSLPQRHVFEVLYKHNLRPIELWPFPVIGPIGISYAFFARKGDP